MITAVQIPADPAAETQRQLAELDHRHALAQAETGHRAHAGVLVLLLREAAEPGDHVVAQDLGLAQRVLGVRRAPRVLLAGGAGGEVGDLRVVTGGPDVVGARDLERGRGVDVTARAERQAEAGERRVRLDARGPHDGVGVGGDPVAQLDAAVDAGGDRGLQVHLDAALLEVFETPLAELGTDLGEDLVGHVHEHEAHVLALDVRVVLGGVAGHVLDLADGLRTREAAAHEDERQRLAADVLVGRGVGLVELLQHVVAQPDRLLDALHADALLGQAGNGERARDGAECHHQVVEGDLVRLADERRDGGDPAVLVDGGDAAGEDFGLRQHAPQRHHDVPRRDAAGRRLGEEGLVRHVRTRVDDGDGCLAVAHLLQDAAGCVQSDVPATNDENSGTLRGAHAIEYPPAPGGQLVRGFTS